MWRRAPGTDQDHDAAAARTDGLEAERGLWVGLLGFKLTGKVLRALPSQLLLRSQNGGLLEQSADAIAANLACGMKPTKESDPAEPFWQDMLEITADEFGGIQWDGLVLSGV